MDVAGVMEELEKMGSEQTKKTFLRHGAQEPFFGVKVGDMKKLLRPLKKEQDVAVALYDTGNSDAMYLAGLAVDGSKLSKETLHQWAEQAYWYMLAEYTVPWVASEHPDARELALEWMESDREMVAVAGWSTYACTVSMTPDEKLDLPEIERLLSRIEATIHDAPNRVRYTMNSFVIATAGHVAPLTDRAKEVARNIGVVRVEMGGTACKVPFAPEYIEKIVARGKIGSKKKTCKC